MPSRPTTSAPIWPASGLWHDQGAQWEVHDYLVYNPSQGEGARRRASRHADPARTLPETAGRRKVTGGVSDASRDAPVTRVLRTCPYPAHPYPRCEELTRVCCLLRSSPPASSADAGPRPWLKPKVPWPDGFRAHAARAAYATRRRVPMPPTRVGQIPTPSACGMTCDTSAPDRSDGSTGVRNTLSGRSRGGTHEGGARLRSTRALWHRPKPKRSGTYPPDIARRRRQLRPPVTPAGRMRPTTGAETREPARHRAPQMARGAPGCAAAVPPRSLAKSCGISRARGAAASRARRADPMTPLTIGVAFAFVAIDASSRGRDRDHRRRPRPRRGPAVPPAVPLMRVVGIDPG